jgi:hypothetical protein
MIHVGRGENKVTVKHKKRNDGAVMFQVGDGIHVNSH